MTTLSRARRVLAAGLALLALLHAPVALAQTFGGPSVPSLAVSNGLANPGPFAPAMRRDLAVLGVQQLRPRSRIWASITDSRGQNGGANISGSSQPWANPATETSTMVSKRSNGFQFWGEFWSRGAIQFPMSLNFGVTGDTAVNMFVTSAASRIDVAISQAVAANAAGMVIWAGTNDWTGSAAYADVIAAYEAAITKCRDAGLLVMLITDTPRGHSTFTSARLSTSNLRKMLRAVQWMRDQRNRPGVFVVDAMADLADPISTVGDWASAQDTSDGTHLTMRAASRVGQRIAAVASVLYPPNPILPTSNADLYDATDNPAGIITANPMMDGTTGSLGGAAGSLATSWAATFANQTGYTITFSKETVAEPDTQTTKPWQKMALSGTPTAGTPNPGFQQTISLATYPVGTRIQVVGELAWDAGMTGVDGVRCGIEGARSNSPGFWLNYAGLVGSTGKEMDASKAYRGTFTTEPYTLASDITSVTLKCNASLILNATLSAGIYARAVGARIVPAGTP